MAGAVQVGALVINMAADVAALKTSLNDATRATQTAAEKMSADFNAAKKTIEGVIDPLKSLTVNIGSLESNLARAQSSALALGKGLLLGAAAGMSIDAIKNKILGVVDGMAHLKEVSEKTGSSVENLSKLAFFAKQSGSDIDSVAAALAKMSKGMAGADADTKGAGLALSYLGIKAKDAAGNLKDPAAMLTEVAGKLGEYKDGAGKAAIAQALFGKAGADMLPTLALMAEQGNIAAKVTDAQATAARQYQRDLARLDAQKGMLFKTIATQLLPTMSDFTNAMIDASKETNVANKAVKGLAEDGSIADWADSAAMGMARLIDVIVMIPKALSAISSSFKVVAADAKFAISSAYLATPQGLGATIGDGKNPITEFRRMLDERNKTLDDANAKYEELWNYDGAKMEKAMAARIAKRKDQTKQLEDATKPPKKDLNFDTSGEDGKAAAAADKEAAAYAGLISAIRAKTDQNRLELEVGQSATESQKTQIKFDQEVASGKLKLTAAHMATARAALVELAASEQAVKAQASQQEITKFIVASTQARNDASAALDVEYALYGKSADARAIAMVAVKAEAEMEKKLAEMREAHKPIADQMIAQLTAEKDARILVEQATLAQGKALQYAAQLHEENKKFGLDYIVDDKARAAASLAIDDQMWQERIRLAGDGTEAQKKLQSEYDIWYGNQSIKPQLDEQKKVWGSIESTAHDTFISIFDSGKSAFNRLRDTLKNGLLDLLYQMTIKKWIFNIGASVSGGGLSGAVQAASGSGSILGSLAQGGSSLYGAVTGGMTVAGGLGTGFMGSLAGGLNGAGIGSGLTSSLGMSIGSGIADVVGPGVASALSSGLGAVASALPWVGAAVAAFAIGKMAFGHGDTEVKGTGIMGWLDGTGAGGQSYQQLHQDGGWFSSDKDWRKGTDFSTEMVAQLSQAFGAVKSSAKSAADALGVSSSVIDSFQTTFDIAYTGDAAKDQQAVTAFFAGISDQLANQLVPNLDAFSKTGETASATLLRLTSDFQATNQIAQLIGKNATDVFGSLGMESATARERLIDLAGGASVLGQQASSYATNFLTDAQKLAPVQAALDAAMAGLGLSSVTTRDQFKACIDSLDLTTEAGAAQFTSMMALADAFAQVHPAIDAAADALKAQAQAEADAAAAITAHIDATKAEAASLMSSVDSAFSVLQAVVEREKKSIQDRVNIETAAITKLTSLSQALHSTLDGMNSPATAVADRANAQAQIRTALALAKAGGVLPDAEAIKKALSTVGQDASGQFASYSDYLGDFYSTKNDIASLAGVTDDALSVEQASLDALNEQLKSLDLVVSDAQKQIDIMKGQSSTLLSIDQAMKGLNTALLSAMANPVNAATKAVNDTYQGTLGRAPDAAGMAYWQQQAASGVSVDAITSAIAGSPEATIQGMYKTMLGHSADAAGLQFWLQQVKNGTSLADIGGAIAGSPEALHSFAVGTNALPSDMVAKVHKDERIIPAADNRELMRRLSSPSDNSAALLTEIKALRSEVSQLKKANSDENYSLNKKTLDMVSLLERVIFGGESINTTTV